MKNNKIILFVIILFIFINVSSNVYSQEWGFSPDIIFNSFADFGIGIGYGVDKHYYLFVPDRESRVKFSIGYRYISHLWYGIGSDVSADDIPNKQYAHQKYNNFYFNTEIYQNLIGDHYTKNYYLDIGFRLYSILKLPFNFDKSKTFYQNETISGDENNLQNELTFITNFKAVNEPLWTILGIYINNEISIKAGSEFDWRFWSFIEEKIYIEGWLPIANRFLYIHFKGWGQFISNSLNEKVNIAFYNYPLLNMLRGVNGIYRDSVLMASQFELISRFLEINPIVPMSFGIGIFTDAGIVGNTISKLKTTNLKLSSGAFFEYRIGYHFLPILIGIHLGVMSEIDINTGEIIKPSLYFSFLIY